MRQRRVENLSRIDLWIEYDRSRRIPARYELGVLYSVMPDASEISAIGYDEVCTMKWNLCAFIMCAGSSSDLDTYVTMGQSLLAFAHIINERSRMIMSSFRDMVTAYNNLGVRLPERVKFRGKIRLDGEIPVEWVIYVDDLSHSCSDVLKTNSPAKQAREIKKFVDLLRQLER